MDDFVFDWNAPSSIWLRCETCGEKLWIDHGQSLDSLRMQVDDHKHSDEREER